MSSRRSLLKIPLAVALTPALTGCDGRFKQFLEYAQGHKSDARDQYRAFMLGDDSALKRLLTMSERSASAAFFVGLAQDPLSPNRNLASPRTAIEHYEAAKVPFDGARFNLCLLKRKQGIQTGVRDDYEKLCSRYVMVAMISYAEFNEPTDPGAAVFWYEKALEEGNYPWARYRLGVLIQQGKGRTPNPEMAAEHFKLAAEQGVTSALTDLARIAKDNTTRLNWTLRYMFSTSQPDATQLNAVREQYGLGVPAFIESADFARNWVHVHQPRKLDEAKLPHRQPFTDI